MTGKRWFAIGCAGLAVVGVIGGYTGSDADVAAPVPGGRLPITSASYVCPNIGGSPEAPNAVAVADVRRSLRPPSRDRAEVALVPMGAQHARPTPIDADPIHREYSDTAAGAAVVTATGSGAGTVAALQRRLNPGGLRRGALSVTCAAPGTDWWLVGAEGGIGYDDELVIANPGTTVANITVTAWSAEGPLEPPKLGSSALEAGTVSRLQVGDYFPDAQHLAIHVAVTSGRVTAAILDSRFTGVTPGGIDWIAPTQPPDRHLVVPGFIGGEGMRRLVISNPGAIDATVGLRVARYDGNFTPAEHPSVVIRAGHSISLDITESLADLPGSVELTSDQPVVAAGLTKLIGGGDRTYPDLQWQPAAAPLRGASVLPDNFPPFERTVHIFLVAPTAAAAVRVTASDGRSKVVRIAEGRTAVFDPEAAFGTAGFGPLVLTPVGTGIVYASRSVSALGSHGPLLTAVQPVPLPRPVELPPVVADQRAATG